MLKTISKITGKHDAVTQKKLLQAFAKADSIIKNHCSGMMQEPAMQYVQAEDLCNASQWQLRAILEQEICSFLHNTPSARQKIQIHETDTRRLLVIGIYANECLFAIADSTVVSNQVVAVIQKYCQSGKAGRFAENMLATRIMESVADKYPHLATDFKVELFLPTARRLFNIASHGIIPEGKIEDTIICDGMPVEFDIDLKSFHAAELLSPLLGPEGKLSVKLKKFFSESLVFPSSLHGIICTGSYAANVLLQHKLKSDFSVPLFISPMSPRLLNYKREQPEENRIQPVSFTIKSNHHLTPLKESQLREQRTLEHARRIVQKEMQALQEKQLKEQAEYDNIIYTDTKTGLQWVRNGNLSGKAMAWCKAQEWVSKLDYAGHKDWRLPTKGELELFVKKGGSRPSEWLESNGFMNVQASYYWSASTDSGYTTLAWIVNMFYGNVYNRNKDNSYYVWPVRAGQ